MSSFTISPFKKLEFIFWKMLRHRHKPKLFLEFPSGGEYFLCDKCGYNMQGTEKHISFNINWRWFRTVYWKLL